MDRAIEAVATEAASAAPDGALRPAGRVLVPGRNVWRLERADAFAVLVDAAAYFAALRRALLAARRRILIVAWDLDSRTRLVGETAPDDGLPEELGAFLTALVQRTPDLSIKLLLWRPSVLYALEREPTVGVALQWQTPPQVELAFDEEAPVGSSQHQKIVVVDDRLAFSGGLDITIRRWDTPRHDPNDARRVDPAGKPYKPFHDVQAAVAGPAAAALAALVRERWLRATGERLEPLADPPPGDPNPWPAGVEPQFRDVAVGIARTAPEGDGAPAVREVEALFADMIATAERTVYLENQFLTCHAVADALVARMIARPRLEAVIVAPKSHHTLVEHMAMQNGRLRFIEAFREAGLDDRAFFAFPEVDGAEGGVDVMVHAKVMIVDDRLLRVGSANIANRSMGADSECDLVVEASTAAERRAIAAVRDGFLAEHCGVAPEEVAAALARGSLVAAARCLGRGRRLSPDLDGAPSVLTSTTIEQWADPDRPLAETEPFAAVAGSADRPRRLRRILAVAAVAAAIALATLAWRYGGAGWMNPDALARTLADLPRGLEGGAIVVGVFVAAGLVVFPVTVLIAATAISFGAWPGIAYAAGGALASALVTYGLGRLIGPDVIRRHMGPRMTKMRDAVAERGVVAVATVRLVPIAPFSLVNLVAGAVRIPVGQYVAGTVLGLAPGIVLMTTLGDRLRAAVSAPSLGSVLLLVLIVAAWGLMSFGLQVLLSRLRKRR